MGRPGRGVEAPISRTSGASSPFARAKAEGEGRRGEGRGGKRPGSDDAEVRVTFTGARTFSEDERLGLEFLERHVRARLTDVLRHQLGGVLAVDSWLSWQEHEVLLTFAFACAPEQVERMRSAMLETLPSIVAEEPSSERMRELRAGFRRDFARRLGKPSFWAEELVRAQQQGADPRRILAMPEWAEKLDAPALRRIARRRLTLDRYRETISLPAAAPARSRSAVP